MDACPDLERLVEYASRARASDGDASRSSRASEANSSAEIAPRPNDDALDAHLRACATCRAALDEIRADEELAERVGRTLATKTSARPGRFPAIEGYAIERELGRGGMGVVYAAIQRASGRRVALKVVRGASWIGETTLKLFQREIQVLARLSHKGIAALYDAGATDDGEHFFAMELVEGRTLMRDAAARALSRRARLELFAKVCDAIQHAHQRGIVHRDLKPSNVLVDELGEPRVLDFGLAKITEADVTLTTLATEAGAIRGTLAYMSPEQARGDAGAIDSRTDVFSLGVVLYELMTGALPNDVSSASLHEAVRSICEDPPARPSELDPSLRGDLETILFKALEKESDRRYASAAALADDVRRFLADEPILARPPSGAYQLQKLVARHRLPFALAGLAFVVAIGSAIALGVLYARAEEQRDAADVARGEESRARLAADAARTDEAAQRALAEARLVEAEEQTDRKQRTLDFFMEMIGTARNESSGPDVRVADVVEKAGAALEARTDLAPSLAAVIGLNIAGVENSLGRAARAEARLRWAIAKRNEVARAADGDDAFIEIQLASVLLSQGKTAESSAALDRAAAILEHATVVHPRVPLLLRTARAKEQRMRGDFAGAEKSLREALPALEAVRGTDHAETIDALTDLAILVADQGRASDAEPITEDLVARCERAFGTSHPTTLNARVNLAMVWLDLERYEDARALLEPTLAAQEQALGPAHQQVLITTNNLAGAYTKLGNKERALEIWRELLPRQEKSLGESSLYALNTRKNIGTMLYQLQRPEESEALLADLVTRCEAHLPKGHWLTPTARTSLGRARITLKRYAEAESTLLAGVAELRAMRGANPAWMRAAADSLVQLYERQNEPEKADAFRELAKTGIAQ